MSFGVDNSGGYGGGGGGIIIIIIIIISSSSYVVTKEMSTWNIRYVYRDVWEVQIKRRLILDKFDEFSCV